MILPEVSVIIPTYNYGHLIEETLTSILNQSFVNWECIIVDNQSSDDTESIVMNWVRRDNRFRYLKIKRSTTSECRNKGLKASKGKFVQFVDADDQISEGKLRNQVTLFKNNPEASIVYSNALYYDHGNNKNLRYSLDNSNKPWMIEFTGYSWDLLPRMLKKNVFVISSPLLKRSLIEEIGGFFNPLNWVEDWEFYIRCFSRNCLIIFDGSQNSSSFIRVHPKSLSRNKIMMQEQSLLARKRWLITLKQLKNYPEKEVLIKENNTQILFLHKNLSNEYELISSFRSKKHLILYAIKSDDFKFFVKILFSYFIKKKINKPD